jgi:hypothetical protein
MLTAPNPLTNINWTIGRMDSRDRLSTRGALSMAFPLSHFPASRIPQPKIPSSPKRMRVIIWSKKFQTPAFFSSSREAVCLSREHSGDAVMVLDIDRDELDNEIQDAFFKSFPCISFFPTFTRHRSNDFLEIQVCQTAVYSDQSPDALHEFEAETALLNSSFLKGNLLRGSFENASSPSGHQFPLSLIIAASNFLSYEIPDLTSA